MHTKYHEYDITSPNIGWQLETVQKFGGYGASYHEILMREVSRKNHDVITIGGSQHCDLPIATDLRLSLTARPLDKSPGCPRYKVKEKPFKRPFYAYRLPAKIQPVGYPSKESFNYPEPAFGYPSLKVQPTFIPSSSWTCFDSGSGPIYR